MKCGYMTKKVKKKEHKKVKKKKNSLLTSSLEKPYFSLSTASSGQNRSFLIRLSSPVRVKNSFPRLPADHTRFGTRPHSSETSARWSSSRS